MRPWYRVIAITALCLLLLTITAPPAQTAAGDKLYVAFVWHQHQPVYFKDPTTDIYERPWVRVHASKDYLDMVTILEQYPTIHATYNLTPSLIIQLEDFMNGAKDLYWVKSEIPAEVLTTEDKTFLLERFFDINPRIIGRFPRYQELANWRGGASEEQIAAALAAWQPQDYLDLQVLFNLAWTDPDFLAQEPLAALVAKGRDFEEVDKALIFQEHLRIIAEILPAHRRLQEAGQIEVTTTPFAHPILPLLVDSNIAQVAMPEAALPPRFTFGQDAVAQVQWGIELYKKHFGVAPRGMWLAEGSVSTQIVQMFANEGIQWLATDEAVLARSLGIGDFTRTSTDAVEQADLLYRPYTVTGGRGGEVTFIFRDHLISDKLGFTYSGMGGAEAAADLIQRLNDIQGQADSPALVTILLDGENAWEHYENDAKAFFHALYSGLSASETIQTVTPSEYLTLTGNPTEQIETLWAGSWITPDFSTWIGEEEENLGWTYLQTMRAEVQKALPSLDPATAEEVMRLVYIAEGSDWFWWYGSDQNSGADENFDAQFRRYLEQIYLLIGKDAPNFVSVPIIAQPPQAPTREATQNLTVTLDGQGDDWDTAAFYETAPLTGLYYGFDDKNLFLRVDAAFTDALRLDFYLRTPDAGDANAYPRGAEALLGFGARRLLEIRFDAEGKPIAKLFSAQSDGTWAELGNLETVATQGTTLEIAIPLENLPARSGDRLNARLAIYQNDEFSGFVPETGSMLMVVPEQAIPNVVLSVQDPLEDDFGPGTFTYPKDAVFKPGAYDATEFLVGYDDEDVIFQVALRGQLVNDWGSPNGMGILTLDVYIDLDGAQKGARLLLPGRNAALTPDHAWDVAIFAEGWEPALYQPTPEGIAVLSNSALTIVSNPGQRRVTIRVPRSVLVGDPAMWSYAVITASQEGFPAAGVLRIRDVLPLAEQWRLGGGSGNSNETRIIDLLLPPDASPSQSEILSTYPPSEADVDSLTADDFAQIPMLSPIAPDQ